MGSPELPRVQNPQMPALPEGRESVVAHSREGEDAALSRGVQTQSHIFGTALIGRIRSELSNHAEVADGITEVKGGILGVEYRPRSMKRGGLLTPVPWDTYTITNPDGTQEVFLEHQQDGERRFPLFGRERRGEEGVWRELWSAPGKRGKRKLLYGPLRVGETSDVFTNPTGEVDETRRTSDVTTTLFPRVKYHSYILPSSDGTQEVYLERKGEKGQSLQEDVPMWQEVWSKQKRFLGVPYRKLLQEAEPVSFDQAAAIRQERAALRDTDRNSLQIYDRDAIEKTQREQAERAQVVLSGLERVKYVPTERDLLNKDIYVKQLQALLTNSKETFGQQVIHMGKLAAVSGFSSLLFWAPQIFPIPGLQAVHVPLSMGVGLLSSGLINKTYNVDGSMIQNMRKIGLTMTGYSIGSLLPIPFGGIIGAGIGFSAGFVSDALKNRMAFRAFVKEHPEVTDHNTLRAMWDKKKMAEKEDVVKRKDAQTSLMQKMQLAKSGKLGEIIGREVSESSMHSETIAQIKKYVPDITDEEMVQSIARLQMQYHATENAAKNYYEEATRHMLRKQFGPILGMYGLGTLGMHLPGIGEWLSGFLSGHPYGISALFTSWYSVGMPLWLRQQVNKVRQEIKEQHPELLPTNGKKRVKI